MKMLPSVFISLRQTKKNDMWYNALNYILVLIYKQRQMDTNEHAHEQAYNITWSSISQCQLSFFETFVVVLFDTCSRTYINSRVMFIIFKRHQKEEIIQCIFERAKKNTARRDTKYGSHNLQTMNKHRPCEFPSYFIQIFPLYLN